MNRRLSLCGLTAAFMMAVACYLGWRGGAERAPAIDPAVKKQGKVGVEVELATGNPASAGTGSGVSEVWQAMERAYARFAVAKGLPKAAREAADEAFLRELARCGEHSLGEVHRFLEGLERQEALPVDRRWLGAVLQELAKTQPKRALDFGLALNAIDPQSYAVPPRTLLGIALQHLTADDAIRVMEMPLRYKNPHRIPSEGSPGEIYRADFDFWKLGEYIVSKVHAEGQARWEVTTYPDAFVASWTQRDPAGAEAFCRAVNDRPQDVVRGAEFLEFLTQLAQQEPASVVADKIHHLMTDPTIEIDEIFLATAFFKTEAQQDILLAAANQLPVDKRDSMGRILLSTNHKPAPQAYWDRVLRLFATDAEREDALQWALAQHPERAPGLAGAHAAFLRRR